MQKNTLQVYAIPGQNGLGSEEKYVEFLLGQNNADVIPVQTPQMTPDFGQRNCLSLLRKAIQPQQEGQDAIIHATSQGTATALNYIAHENKDNHIKALILEATLASGNSAIHHTVGGPLMRMDGVTKLPLSYYWLPYLAKGMFPFYWPAGKQAINGIDKIPTTMPVIIAHSKHDPQLAYNDACALYYGLREHGNNNTYFFQQEGFRHIQILTAENAAVVRAILQKHGLLKNAKKQGDGFDLTPYQPDHKQFKKQYDDLTGKEKNHVRMVYAGLCAATYYGYKKIFG